MTRIYIVVDNYCMHKAKAIGHWLASHARFEVLWLLISCELI